MRSFLILVVIAGLSGLYYWQKHHETVAATGPAKPPAAAVAQLSPAPSGQASEHNWMKRSLDRARDVTEQARAQTQESQKQ